VPDEDLLGEIIVTGKVQKHVPKIAVLPSLSPAYEDVVVRSVVRRDLEISGLFRVIPDDTAPTGTYGFNDPVDVGAWQSLGAEAIVKVAAREKAGDKIEVLGLAYFPSAGVEPVYKTKLVVEKSMARVTAHHITDALLGALTGFPGGFSSRFTFSAPWGRNLRVFTVDADGYGLTPRTDQTLTAIGPTYGPDGILYYSSSKNYSPFHLVMQPDGPSTAQRVALPFTGNIYSTTFNQDKSKLAVAVSEDAKSSIYVGTASGKNFQRVSTTELATHPVFSSEGQLAWVGGAENQGSSRVYVDGKAISPKGFTAASPTFCSNENGTFIVYSVSVGGGRSDLVLSQPGGKGMTRLTQNQGSNTSPACSPDGRMLAFFSTRNNDKGLYVLSLVRWTTQKVLSTSGQGLRWEPLLEAQLTSPGSTKAAPNSRPPTMNEAQVGPACGLAPPPK
jgi:TolB protein